METLEQTNMRLRKRVIKLADMLRIARYSADHDVLTGLPNRRLFFDRLRQAMMLSIRQQRQLAVLMIDLDGFKTINDQLGHAIGDQLLRQVADRLMLCLRGSDTASRLGGDEFAILLQDVSGHHPVMTVIKKIRQCLDGPYLLCNKTLAVGASIGVAIYDGEGLLPDQVLELADQDMYRDKAKRRGRMLNQLNFQQRQPATYETHHSLYLR